MTVKRVEITLSDAERGELRHLPGLPGAAFAFWRRVATARGFEPGSLWGDERGRVTGLPLSHGQYWCFPSPLFCKKPARWSGV